LKVFQDYAVVLEQQKKPESERKITKTTLESDLEMIDTLKQQGRQVEPKLEENLRKLYQWWLEEGLPYYSQDQNILPQARLHGAKMALLYTAFVPASLAIGFLILILYFWLLGGYKQVHLEQGGAERETRDY
jgi:hypothetical protein